MLRRWRLVALALGSVVVIAVVSRRWAAIRSMSFAIWPFGVEARFQFPESFCALMLWSHGLLLALGLATLRRGVSAAAPRAEP